MNALRKILFPVDFSEASIAMAPFVKEVAQQFDATVTVLNAFNLVREYSLAPNAGDLRGTEPVAIHYTGPFQELRDQRARRLEEFTHTQFPDIGHSAQIEDGDPALVIEWAASHDRADVIMMPTKGLGRFRRLLMGSVTAKVLHDVTCPVLTTVHELEPALTLFNGFRSILCAVSLSAQSDTVFRAAGFFAQNYGARICLLHIEALSEEKGCQPTSQEIKSAFGRAVGSDGPGAGANITARIMDAAIPEGIRQAAIEEAADLVVVGRGHSMETFSRVWSHLYAIIRESPCPVLSV